MACVKIRLVVFMVIGLLGSALLPALNLFVFAQVSFAEYKAEGFGKKLYTFDGIEGLWNKKLMTYGLSGDLASIVVGSEGYLFLGNAHSETISKHVGAFAYEPWLTLTQEMLTRRVSYFKDKNLRQLFVIVPDKETIYPEMLPEWYKVTEQNTYRTALAALLLRDKSMDFLDLTTTLTKNKDKGLYLQTDSHWNQYGSYLGYLEVMTALDPSLKLFDDLSFNKHKVVSGDLARMLKLALPEFDVDYGYVDQSGFDALMIKTCVLDKETFEESDCNEGVNHIVFGNLKPITMYSPDALNQKTLLWVRDSFGASYERIANGTFSKIIAIHYLDLMGGDRLNELVEKYHPDYLLYQVVERQLDWIR